MIMYHSHVIYIIIILMYLIMYFVLVSCILCYNYVSSVAAMNLAQSQNPVLQMITQLQNLIYIIRSQELSPLLGTHLLHTQYKKRLVVWFFQGGCPTLPDLFVHHGVIILELSFLCQWEDNCLYLKMLYSNQFYLNPGGWDIPPTLPDWIGDVMLSADNSLHFIYILELAKLKSAQYSLLSKVVFSP